MMAYIFARACHVHKALCAQLGRFMLAASMALCASALWAANPTCDIGNLRWTYTTAGAITGVAAVSGGNVEGSISVPSSLNGVKITSLSSYAFDGKNLITQISIPEGVSSIGADCFRNCKRLPRLTLPSTVRTIGNYAFYNCSELYDVGLNEGLTDIGSSAFVGCSSLKSLKLPSTLLTIGGSAFEGVPIEAMEIPDSVTSIGSDIFQDCAQLGTVTVGRNVQGLTSYMFDGCTALSSVTLKNNGVLRSIGTDCFRNCKRLPRLTLPSTVRTIGNYAFYNCSELYDMGLNEGLTDIGSSAFVGCSSLRSLKLPSTLLTIGGSAFEGVPIEAMEIPDSVTSIGSDIFQDCTQLGTVTVGRNVQGLTGYMFDGCTALSSVTLREDGLLYSIGADCFRNCKRLTRLMIPSTVRTIGNYAFYNCVNLDYIYFKGDYPTSFSSSAFNGVKDAMIVYRNASSTGFGSELLGHEVRVWQGEPTPTPATYTVTFNSNGGSGSMTAQTFTQGVSQSLKLNAFTKSGYTFDGWMTSPSGSVVAYNDGQSITVSANMTLYAKWKAGSAPAPDTYTVTFDSNGGEGTMSPQTFIAGEQQSLAANKFTKDGYYFSGWALRANGELVWVLADGAYIDIALTQQDITLYAMWASDAETGLLRFHSDNGIVSDGLWLRDVILPEEAPCVATLDQDPRVLSVIRSGGSDSNGLWPYVCSHLEYTGMKSGYFYLYHEMDVGDETLCMIAQLYTNAPPEQIGGFCPLAGVCNVPAGDYSIRVKASAPDGSVSKTRSITINEPSRTVSSALSLDDVVSRGLISIGGNWIGTSIDGMAISSYVVKGGRSQLRLTANCPLYYEFDACLYNLQNVAPVTAFGDSLIWCENQDTKESLPPNEFKRGQGVLSAGDSASWTYARGDSDMWLSDCRFGALTNLFVGKVVNVYFDSNGGGSVDPVLAVGGKNYGFLGNQGIGDVAFPSSPTPPSSEAEFLGWYDGAGMRVTAQSIVPENAEDHTLTARWSGSGETLPDLLPYTPNGWSAPIVVVRSSSDTIDATDITADDTLYVRRAYICRNADVTTRFYIKVFVDGVEVNSMYSDGLLQNKWKGGSADSYCKVGRLSAGTHAVKMVVDSAGAVAESDESNNTYTKTITVGKGTPCVVTFDGNGGTLSSSTRAVARGDAVGTLPPTTRPGYTLDGWYTSGGSKISASTIVNSDVTFYARWTYINPKCTVAFHANGGLVSPESKTIVGGTEIGTLPTPVRSGYSFNGWYTSSSGGTRVSSTTKVNSSVTYYAHWSALSTYSPDLAPRTLTVYSASSSSSPYNKNDTLSVNWSVSAGGASVAATFYSALYVDNVKKVERAISGLSAGYMSTFSGESIGRLSEGTHTIKLVVDSQGNVSESNESNNTFTKTITVIDPGKTYVLKLHRNNSANDGATAGRTHTVGVDYDLPKLSTDLNWSRTGYDFIGWATSSTATSAKYLDGQMVKNLSTTKGATVHLYAVWKAHAYNLCLHRNNSSKDTAMAGRALTYNKDRALPKIADELKWAPRSDYTFLGWATSASATSAKYSDGQSVKNLSTAQGATVHLYAVWKKDDATPQFTFGGDASWTKQSDGSWKSGALGDNESAYMSMKVTGPGTISFKWKTSSESNYDKLHFYVNGSEPVAAISGEMDNWASVTYNVTVSGTVTLKWEYQKDVSASAGSDCGWIKDVAWSSTASAKTYIVRLHRNNSERDGSTAGRTYTIGKARALPKVQNELKWAPRKGYDFLGWSKSATATTATYTDGQSLKDLTTTAGATVHLYAVWKAHKYIVRLHRNNSKNDGATTGRAFDYDQVRFLPTMAELKWVRSGYMFLGWSQAQSSTTVKYADGLNVFNLSPNDGEELHVWGVWKKAEANAYLLRLHRNNSERDGATAGRQLKINTFRKLPTVKELNWTRTDATFKGWATTAKDATAGRFLYADGADVANLVSTQGDTAHLYAVWQ